MGPSTGSSPCSDSCFKALRAAWEEREQQMVEWGGGGGAREGERRETGWEESECHPSAAFQITLTLGNLMPAGHFPFALCCLWLLSSDCLSSVIGLTFPLYVLAALHFPKSISVTSVFSATTAKRIAAGQRARNATCISVWSEVVKKSVCEILSCYFILLPTFKDL